jgi:hypothetical protein
VEIARIFQIVWTREREAKKLGIDNEFKRID